jgi:hypothetical protein
VALIIIIVPYKTKSLLTATFTQFRFLFIGTGISTVTYVSTYSTAALSSQHSVLADLVKQPHVEPSEHYVSRLFQTVSHQPNPDQSSLSCWALWSYSTATYNNKLQVIRLQQQVLFKWCPSGFRQCAGSCVYLCIYISCFTDSPNSPYGSEYKTCQCNIIE